MVFIESLKVVCAFCSFFAGYTVLSDKRLQSHPGYLVGIICLLQGGYIFAFNQRKFLCSSEFYKVFGWFLQPLVPGLKGEDKLTYVSF